MQAITKTFKQEGFAAVLRKHKWSVLVPVVLAYLVRDVCIYVLLPYLVVKGL